MTTERVSKAIYSLFGLPDFVSETFKNSSPIAGDGMKNHRSPHLLIIFLSIDYAQTMTWTAFYFRGFFDTDNDF